MKPIVYADYGSWKVYMNALVGQIDKIFSFMEIQTPMESNSTTKCRQPPCRNFTFPPASCAWSSISSSFVLLLVLIPV